MIRLSILYLLILFISCQNTGSISKTKNSHFEKKEFTRTFTDERDQTVYGIIEVANRVWFAENLKFKTPKSVCYKKKEVNCNRHGRLYPYDELDNACPSGWRVPNIKDWKDLKSNSQQDSIYALLDTMNWNNPINHTNESGLSIQGVGYQLEKRLFLGSGTATSLWLNQFNKFDEYYHVHLYGGEGTSFEKSGYITNEVFHAHPIDDLDNRRLSIRCVCDRNE